jgi:ribosomal protein S18 acetylase RimI-like enzyme
MRKASPDDVQQLVELMTEFYTEAGYPLNRQRAGGAFATLLADERLGSVWLIEADAQIVGYLVLTICFSMENGGLIAVLDDFYIRAAFRGAGLGTKALAEMREFCLSHNLRAVSVEVARANASAQKAYRRTGFAETDRQLLTLRLADPTHVG